MNYGYVRVRNLSDEHVVERHSDLLRDLGAEKIIVETDGTQFQSLLDILKPNDSLFIYSIDRLSRKIDTLRKIFKRLSEKEVNLYAGKERIELSGISAAILFAEIDAQSRL